MSLANAYKYCLIFSVAFLQCMAAQSSFAGKYHSLDDFFIANPQEKQKFDYFNQLVKRNSVSKLKDELEIKIAIVYPEKQVSDYWRRSYKSFVVRLEQYGIKPELHSFFIKPTTSLNEQGAVFRQALETDPDYLIFTLNALRHQRMIEPTLIRNRPKMILQNITTPLKAWDGKQPFMYIGFDHATGTRKLAEYFATKTGGNGNYAVLLPGAGYLSEERGRTFISWLDQHTYLKMVSVFQTGIDKEKARKATIKIVEKHPEVKFIYACSTDISLGAIEGLKETGMLGKIMVNGWGGGSPEIKAMEKGEMDVTVMRINDDNGVAMADAIIMDMLGQDSKIPLVYSGRFELVGKDIRPIDLERLQSESFRYSGKDQ